MTNILIIYTTTMGSTKQMADAIIEGARSVPGTQVTLKEAQTATQDDVRDLFVETQWTQNTSSNSRLTMLRCC